MIGKLRLRLERNGQRAPGGESGGKWVRSSEYCLGMVGERSSGDEGQS